VEGGAEMGHVREDKKAFKKTKELAERIVELCQITHGRKR
jgi:hypothetical protein